MSNPKFHDCLKYWKVIRQWVKSRYKINQADLDMLLFLYSESYFKRSDFDKFDNLLTWDTRRFDRLLADGWVEKYRQESGRQRAIYRLSYKCKRMIYSVYQKLSGEDIPDNKTNNPMFHRRVKFSEKVYRNFISDLNNQRRAAKLDPTRREQHLSPEL